MQDQLDYLAKRASAGKLSRRDFMGKASATRRERRSCEHGVRDSRASDAQPQKGWRPKDRLHRRREHELARPSDIRKAKCRITMVVNSVTHW